MSTEVSSPADVLRIGTHTLKSRLIVGTGKYETFDIMAQALALSGADCLTVAVRRERWCLHRKRGAHGIGFHRPIQMRKSSVNIAGSEVGARE